MLIETRGRGRFPQNGGVIGRAPGGVMPWTRDGFNPRRPGGVVGRGPAGTIPRTNGGTRRPTWNRPQGGRLQPWQLDVLRSRHAAHLAGLEGLDGWGGWKKAGKWISKHKKTLIAAAAVTGAVFTGGATLAALKVGAAKLGTAALGAGKAIGGALLSAKVAGGGGGAAPAELAPDPATGQAANTVPVMAPAGIAPQPAMQVQTTAAPSWFSTVLEMPVVKASGQAVQQAILARVLQTVGTNASPERAEQEAGRVIGQMSAGNEGPGAAVDLGNTQPITERPWFWPAAIGGGALLLVLLMKK